MTNSANRPIIFTYYAESELSISSLQYSYFTVDQFWLLDISRLVGTTWGKHAPSSSDKPVHYYEKNKKKYDPKIETVKYLELIDQNKI